MSASLPPPSAPRAQPPSLLWFQRAQRSRQDTNTSCLFLVWLPLGRDSSVPGYTRIRVSLPSEAMVRKHRCTFPPHLSHPLPCTPPPFFRVEGRRPPSRWTTRTRSPTPNTYLMVSPSNPTPKFRTPKNKKIRHFGYTFLLFGAERGRFVFPP